MELFIYNDLFDSDTDYQATWKSVFKEDLSSFLRNLDPSNLYPYCSDPSIKYLDYSLYDGIGSKLFVLLRLHTALQRDLIDSHFKSELKLSREALVGTMKQVLSVCLSIIQKKRNSNSKRRIAFYTGESGVYALGIQLGVLAFDDSLVNQNFNHLLDLYSYLVKNKAYVQYELLYGVPGFLYAILYTHKHLRGYDFDSRKLDRIEEMVDACVNLIVKHGDDRFKVQKNHSVNMYNLVYDFHGSEYTGGAHGLAGNLMVLMLVYQEFPRLICSDQKDNIAKIMNSMEFLLSIQNLPAKSTPKKTSYLIDWTHPEEEEFTFDDKAKLSGKQIYSKFQPHYGGWPSRNDKPKRVKKVQFCHGSPGVVLVLLQFQKFIQQVEENLYECTINEKYLEDLQSKNQAAVVPGLVNIWAQGLLKKGYGLCHGIAGNAFSFLLASKCQLLFESQEETEVLRSMCLAFMSAKKVDHVWKSVQGFSHPQRYRVGICDFPFGLMNGLAGDVCLHLDLLGLSLGFPGFNL